MKICLSIGIDVENEENSKLVDDISNLKLCFLEGFFQNLARNVNGNNYVTVKNRWSVAIHPSSFANRKNYFLVCFIELVLT